MGGVYLLVPTLAAIAISMLIVRAGAIALMMTGMSYEKAKFQSLSAFSGTGFTTREAERVVNNTRRRKIVSWLMILGNVGVVTVIVTATSSFARAKGLGMGLSVVVLIAGLALIVFLARHTPLARHWETFIQSRLKQLKIFEEEVTVDELLHIAEGYGVVRVHLQEGSTFIGKQLSEVYADLGQSLLLGVERGRQWLPTPGLTGNAAVGDCLVIYGKVGDLSEHFD